MACALRLAALALTLLLAATAATVTTVRVHVHNKAAATTTPISSNSNSSLSCGAAFTSNPKQPPVLSTTCPSVCGASNFCVFYPSSAKSLCSERYGLSSCFDGDVCTFECLTAWGNANSWFITVYDSDAMFAELDALNSGFAVPSVLVNATAVTKLDAFDRPSGITQITFMGNEIASSLIEENGGIDDRVDRGDVVTFAFPANFLRQLQGADYIRIENIAFPPTVGADDLVFKKLTVLSAANTLLKSLPIPAKSMPILDDLDLSANYIETLNKGVLPTRLNSLLLDTNLLRQVPEDVKSMTALKGLTLSSNALKTIPSDSLPSSLEQLQMRNCSLEVIPVDIAHMRALTDIDLSENNFTAAALNNLSVLPTTLQTLVLDALGFDDVPLNLQRLVNLTDLSLTDNAFKAFDVARLPPQLQTLYIDRCHLTKLPTRLNELTNLTTLSAGANPISELTPGSLPLTLKTLTLRAAKVPKIAAGVLPPATTSLSIDESGLVETPPDLAKMTLLSELSLISNRLTKCEFGSNLQTLTTIHLANNSLTTFAARLPAVTYLSLSNNKLTTFEATKAAKLESLYLDSNALVAVPPSVFNMTKLKVLVLTNNPIRDFAPTIDEFTFLSQLSLLAMDQTQCASKCPGDRHRLLQGLQICEPRSVVDIAANSHDLSTSAKGRLSIVLNVLLVAVLVLTVAAAYHKRKLRKQKLDELVKRGIAELRSADSSDLNIWDDDVLLRHRLDATRVKRVRPLASGMFGDVWLAVYDKRKVALKSLKETDATREVIATFVAEIKLLATCAHPKVVQFIGVVWTKESDLAVVTEFMVRGDLRAHLDAAGVTDTTDTTSHWDAQALSMALDVTEALVYLHSLEPKLIHRDLKSRNVLLDAAYHAKLSDFGVSRFQRDDVDDADNVTAMTACVGTVRWVAPEVLAGERYNESVDIYSLGVILSELETRRLPFADVRSADNESLSDLAIAHLVLAGELTASFSAACPPAVRALGIRCCAFDPTARPTAVQVAFELRALLVESEQCASSSTISVGSAGRHDNDDVGGDEYDSVDSVDMDEDAAAPAVNRDGMIVV